MTAGRPIAWVLNLDAEYELESERHTPSAKTLARLPELIPKLGALFGPDDWIVGAGARASLRDPIGRAWCPTPRARSTLVKAGVTPAPAPPLAILRRVNHRRFAVDLAAPLPGARYVTTLDALIDTIAAPSPTGHWLLKRPFGFAGRGRRRVWRGALEAAAQPWVKASLATGEGLQVEPWVERAGDYALHGFVAADRTLTLGVPTAQRCDDAGSWRETVLATDLAPEEQEALTASARRAAAALADAGYFGPFGVDAYRWRDGARLAFHPLSELNARYSMGWAVGMGDRRPDRDA